MDEQLNPAAAGSAAGRLAAFVRTLWSPVIFAYAITGSVAVASFLSTLVLARLAGPSVIGEYALALSTANMLASFAMLGLDPILIREIAGDLHQGNSSRARAALRVIAGTIAFTAFTTAAAWAAATAFTPLAARIGGTAQVMLIVSASILLWPILRVGISTLRATGSPVLGQLFEAIPTFLFLSAMLSFLVRRTAPSAAQAIGAMVVAQILAGLIAWLLLRPRIGRWAHADAASFQRRALLAGLPLMATLFLQLFSDWLLLARLSATMGTAETGAFRVAVQIVTILMTLVATTESYVAARLAADFRSGRPDLAWARHRQATWLILALTAPALLLFLLAPGPLLRIAFGPQFEMAATALLIMAVAQLFNVLRGPLGSLLTMSGNERVLLHLTLVGLGLVVVLSWVLIPRYGLAGAAIAQAAPVIFRSVTGYVVAWRRIPRHAPQEHAPQ